MLRGSNGESVQDLQRRLASLEIDTEGDDQGAFGDATEQAVRLFQVRRGLRVDGVCGGQTWDALVEAGYCLGDRLLYRRTPMLRGDDVAELQRRLGSLGFDAGRVDGIFGDSTARAISEFQRNAGLTVDAIFGRSTLAELVRLQTRSEAPQLVSAVRERERLRQAPRTLEGLTIAVGEHGGLSAAVAAVAHSLSSAGAEVVTLQHPDGSRLAEEANNARVDVYVGLGLDLAGNRCSTAHYSGYRYESAGGRRLAELIQARAATALGLQEGRVQGMSIPILRETRMTAVVCDVGPPSLLVEASSILASALTAALAEWVNSSWE